MKSDLDIPMDRSFRFCILLTLGVMIPATFMVVPLYLRHQVYASYHVAVSSSDWRHLDHRVSTVWCESLRVRMNTTFNAYLLSGDLPHFENSTRTYWTTKHFSLRSEEREYWGFYLPKGSVFTLAMCARYDGAKVHVFKGKRNMKKCVKREDDSYEEDNGALSDEDDDYLTDDDMNDDTKDTDEDEEESSFSSSEEDFERECSGAIFNQTLTQSSSCESPLSWQPKDVVTYTVSSSDYYYALFSSLNNIFVNKIHTKIVLQKPVYGVTSALGACINATECNLPFQFNSKEHVVLEVPNRDEWLADIGHVSCEPRTMLYFPFYLGIPISILFFAFRGSK